MIISPKTLYDILLNTFGQQHWWPIDEKYHLEQNSDPRFEIIVGAFLTQNTAWTNVEKALNNLKRQKALTIHKIAHIKDKSLKTMIQPSGFFNQKAKRLKLFSTYMEKKYKGDLQKLFSQETSEIRHELLSLKGVGLETADSILLYAGNHAVFVVDSYTKRISQRFPFLISSTSYEEIQIFFENELASTISKKEIVSAYREFHALLVKLAKEYCWKDKPNCTICPLTTLCKKCL
ncbi:endonuclease [Thermoplasmatales archaeon SM1-50]|nr:MAG: endonuclease [Thermoplasmatales archaeon SM1-50]